MEIVEINRPEPKEGEVLVNICMRPVNPADIFSLQGRFQNHMSSPDGVDHDGKPPCSLHPLTWFNKDAKDDFVHLNE